MARTISIAGPQFLTQQRSWRQLSAATHSHSKTLACPFPSRQIDTNSYHPDRCRYEKACKAFQEDNGGLQRSPARAVNLEGADAYVDSDTGTHPSGQQHSEALPVGMAPGAGQIGSSETWRTKQVRTPMRVLLFVPNLLGYARLVLLACAVHAFCVAQAQASCFWMLIASLSLDFLDGMLARRLGQSSAFGAFLDVLIDITTRALIWTWAVGAAAVPVIILEATTFVCTHAGGGAAWKVGCFADAPAWVAAAVADNFRSIGGVIAIGGIMGLPLWLWACRYTPGWPIIQSSTISAPLGLALLLARLYAAAVEVWVVARHMRGLLQADCRARHGQQ